MCITKNTNPVLTARSQTFVNSQVRGRSPLYPSLHFQAARHRFGPSALPTSNSTHRSKFCFLRCRRGHLRRHLVVHARHAQPAVRRVPYLHTRHQYSPHARETRRREAGETGTDLDTGGDGARAKGRRRADDVELRAPAWRANVKCILVSTGVVVNP